MFGGQRHKGRTKQGILTGSKNPNRVSAIFKREVDLTAVTLADPVALHDKHTLRPARQLIGVIKKLFGIIGNPKEPLIKLFKANISITTPAAAILNLLVGKYGFALWTPIDERCLFVSKPLCKHFQEKLLFPAVIVEVACCQFAVPVVGKTKFFDLITHIGNIFIRPGCRVALVLNGRVFSRHTKGVPPHRMHDIETLHPFETTDNITY